MGEETLLFVSATYTGDQPGIHEIVREMRATLDRYGERVFSTQEQVVKLPGRGQGRLLLSTHLDREGLIPLSEVHLRANEGLLLEVEASSLPGE